MYALKHDLFLIPKGRVPKLRDQGNSPTTTIIERLHATMCYVYLTCFAKIYCKMSYDYASMLNA